jgi:23S rRNA pseudouridine2604 synthase
MKKTDLIRINKYLRDKGFSSRKEADKLIEKGSVLVNGKRAKMGMMVGENDIVTLKNSGVKKKTCLAYYKPRGLATQGSGENTPTVIDEWQKKGLFPVGRLDKESEGLLLLTDDGRITTALLGADSKLEKEYTVKVREKLRPGIIAIFAKGMKTKTFGSLLPAKAKILDEHAVSITIREGKRHQIRVMLDELNYTVTALKRVRIGKISLGSLRPGKTKELSEKEIEELLK